MASSICVPAQWFETLQEVLQIYPLPFSLIFFSVLFLLWHSRVQEGTAINLPPSPPRLPIIGHLHCLSALPHRSLQSLSDKYGPLMLLHMGQIRTLVVSSAEMAREIMKTHDITFSDRPISTASKAFLYGGKDMAFAPYGEHWRQMKKLCIQDILNIKRVESFRSVREGEIGNMIRKIKQSCSLGKEVNLSDLLMGITNNIISRIALSKSLEGGKGKSVYAKLIEETMELFGFSSMEDMFPSLGWLDKLNGTDRRMRKTSKKIHQFFDQVIEEHLMSRKDEAGRNDCRDFVDLLLDYEKESTLTVEFGRKNLIGLLMNMFIAGTDTTYTTLEWAMAELVNHPNVMKRLQEEVREVVGKKSEVDENELKQVNYLNYVIKETLRLHPPLALSVPRESSRSATVKGYHIPSKTTVIINAWAIARDPKLWDKPNEFIPERFVNNPIDFRGQDFEYIPFGAGRRGCPGISFGIINVESILGNLLYWFGWEMPQNDSNKNIDMTEVFGLSVKLKTPLRLVPNIAGFLSV